MEPKIKSRKPPGMRLKEQPSFEELEHWRAMHENSFFNPYRIVTKQDVIDTTNHTLGHMKTANAAPNPYSILGNSGRSLKNRLSIGTHNRLIGEFFAALPPPEVHKDSVDYVKTKASPLTPISPSSKERDKMDLQLTRNAKLPKQASPLLRRPLVSDTYCNIPIVKLTPRPTSSNRNHLHLDTDLSIDEYLELWKRNSLTTLEREDPLNPKSFYNTNYPLLMKLVPRRIKTVTEEEQTYRTAGKTPDIDMSYFRQLPLGRLPSDISLSGSETDDTDKS